MNPDKVRQDKDLKVRRAISAHEAYKNSWAEDRCAFSRVMISPRGARHDYSSYCAEVNKHMVKTVAKIRKILEVTP